MANKFHLDIFTPKGKYFSNDVEFLEVRNDDSVLGILAHHTPLISTIKLGVIKIRFNGKTRYYATTGGLLNVKKDNTVSLMLNTIERGDEIDVERAKRSIKRAEKHLQEEGSDKARAEASLERANNRLLAAEEDKK